LHPYINEANKNAGWNFQWDWSEACQFTIYKKNQFYDWHADSWEKSYDDPSNLNTNGKIRKLSMTLSLSDENDYEGGDLEFDPRNYHNIKNSKTLICKEVKPKGSLVVFPSFVYHRITPVTKGTRYSLVMWNLGHPFK
jgi:PKHD-type hydroxylase